MQCRSCGFANPEGVKFCIECGVAMQHRCPSCGGGESAAGEILWTMRRVLNEKATTQKANLSSAKFAGWLGSILTHCVY
jgi:hypothetical protein